MRWLDCLTGKSSTPIEENIAISCGRTDKESHVDHLGVSNYYQALAEYIVECETPMFISVEGDWGTGKSTAISHITDRLNEHGNIDVIRLNMWPYAGMESGADVVRALMQDFSRELKDAGVIKVSDKDKMVDCVKEYGLSIVSIGASVLSSTEIDLNTFLKQSPADNVLKFGKELEKAIAQRSADLSESAAGTDTESSDYRLVTIIDDLDRLNPLVAVEVIEAFKNFADKDSCVFLISVDMRVVSRGTKMKYGDWFGKNRAQRFFDKVFQLRFHLPVNAFDTAEYVRVMLGQEEVDDSTRRFATAARELLHDGYGNPRNIKRAFNLLDLYKRLEALEGGGVNLNDFVLFSSLLIQIYSPTVYRALTNHCASSEELANYIGTKSAKDGFEKYMRTVDRILELGIFDSIETDEDDKPMVNMGKVSLDNVNAFAICLLNTAKISEPQETVEKKKAKGTKRKPRGRLTFSELGIEEGAVLTFVEDETITATVVSGNKVLYDGEVTSLTRAAQIIKDYDRPLQGPKFWCYKGKPLTVLRDELSED